MTGADSVSSPVDLTIGHVSKILAVPMPTLRSWERRYGIPFRIRRNGTTRRYTCLDAQLLMLMRDDIARGVRAADAAASVRTVFDPDRIGAVFVNGLLQASVRCDFDGVTRWLERAAAELGLGVCLDEVLFPAMRRIGLTWQADVREVGRQRATTDVVCRWLTGCSPSMPLRPGTPAIVLAPTDQHNIGLQALAVLLRHRHYQCVELSGGLSVHRLTDVVLAHRPAGVVLLSQLPSLRLQAVQWLRALHDVQVLGFYAGNAFSSPRNRRGVPGRYLGINLQHGAELIDLALARH